MTENPSFSINEEFQKLKEGESIQIKCDGYNFTHIIDKDDDCYFLVKGKEISDKVLLGNIIQKKDNSWSLIQVFTTITLVWLLSWALLKFIPIENRGTFGDMFGSVNALFSGLALGGIVFTIFFYKKKELKLQRKELRDTREEFSIQNETLKQQRFENTFFKMLDLHHQITDNLSYTDHYYPTSNGKLRYENPQGDESIEYKGNKVFEISWELMSNYILNGQLNKNEPTNSSINKTFEKIQNKYILKKLEIEQKQKSKSNLEEYSIEFNKTLQALEEEHYKKLESNIVLRSFILGYKSFYDMFEDNLNQYITNLYHIFKYILTTDLIEKDKKQFYASLVRAQLSQKEMLLIYFNSVIPDYGNPNFLFLIKEYDIIQNLNYEILHKSNLNLIIPLFNKMSEDLKNPFLNKNSLPVQIHQNEVVRSVTW